MFGRAKLLLSRLGSWRTSTSRLGGSLALPSDGTPVLVGIGQSEVSATSEIAAASTTEVTTPKVASAEVSSSAEARVRNRRSAI